MQRQKETKSAAKKAMKDAVKNAAKNSTAEKQLFGIYHDCFHFGLGTLLATRFLDPFHRRSAVSEVLSLGLALVRVVKQKQRPK